MEKTIRIDNKQYLECDIVEVGTKYDSDSEYQIAYHKGTIGYVTRIELDDPSKPVAYSTQWVNHHNKTGIISWPIDELDFKRLVFLSGEKIETGDCYYAPSKSINRFWVLSKSSNIIAFDAKKIVAINNKANDLVFGIDDSIVVEYCLSNRRDKKCLIEVVTNIKKVFDDDGQDAYGQDKITHDVVVNDHDSISSILPVPKTNTIDDYAEKYIIFDTDDNRIYSTAIYDDGLAAKIAADNYNASIWKMNLNYEYIGEMPTRFKAIKILVQPDDIGGR